MDKVRRINPDNYYVVTSVGLTPRNKDDIKELFAPYIKDTTQILGSNDINNLLGNFDDVEKKHYKLWLTSTNILQSIINKEVINWSDFELQHIKQQIATYVPNKSLEQARNILSQYNYVIISGIPGIGKTTLANILLYDYLAHGYEEFVIFQVIWIMHQSFTIPIRSKYFSSMIFWEPMFLKTMALDSHKN